MSSPYNTPPNASPRGSISPEYSPGAFEPQPPSPRGPFNFKSQFARTSEPSLPIHRPNAGGHARKDSLFVKSGASPEEIAARLLADQSHQCNNCGQLRKTNYALLVVLAIGFVVSCFTRPHYPHPYDLAHHYAKQHDVEKASHAVPHVYDSISEPLQVRDIMSEIEARATTSTPANVIYPFYIDPMYTDYWNQLFAQIQAYQSTMQFTIIVNPNNGPGTKTDTVSYTPLLKKLATYSNVKIVAYVHQTWGQRNCQPDIDTWLSYYPNLLDGIFFDEGPTDAADANYVFSNTAYVKAKVTAAGGNKFRTASPMSIQNPGCEVDASYYGNINSATVTVVLEDSAANYNSWLTSNRPSSNVARNRKAMMLLNTPNSTLSNTVSNMLSNVQYIFASDLGDDAYATVSGQFNNFMSVSNKLGGSSSSGSAATTSAAANAKAVSSTTTSSRTSTTSSRTTTTSARTTTTSSTTSKVTTTSSRTTTTSSRIITTTNKVNTTTTLAPTTQKITTTAPLPTTTAPTDDGDDSDDSDDSTDSGNDDSGDNSDDTTDDSSSSWTGRHHRGNRGGSRSSKKQKKQRSYIDATVY